MSTRRRILYSDITTVARALLCVPDRKRAHFCLTLINEAAANGQSLMARARLFPLAREPRSLDPEYIKILRLVLELVEKRNGGD